MISCDSNVTCRRFLQDFDYGLNWKTFLKRLGLPTQWEDWDNFVRDECAKLAEQRKRDLEVQWRRLREAYAARQAQQSSDASDLEDDAPAATDDVGQAVLSEEGQTSQLPGCSPQYLDTEVGPDALKECIGTQNPIASALSDDPPCEEVKRQWKQRTGTLQFRAIDLLDSGDVVHEVRHDLESFFWLFIWVLLRHTVHMLGPQACGNLFNHDNDGACQIMKLGLLVRLKSLKYPDNKPLTQVVAELTAVCMTNSRTEDAEPLDPFTYENVLDIFDRALARESEWPTRPTTTKQAISRTIPELDQLPSQCVSRVEGDTSGSRIKSGINDVRQVDGRRGSSRIDGSRRSVCLANGTPDTNSARAASGSRSRKRSRGLRETTDKANDANSGEERRKRTKKNSKPQDDATSGERKHSKVRRVRK